MAGGRGGAEGFIRWGPEPVCRRARSRRQGLAAMQPERWSDVLGGRGKLGSSVPESTLISL